MKPETKDKYVGVEIELISRVSREKLRQMLKEANLQNYTDVTDDGSIDTYPEGYYDEAAEIRVLAKEKEIQRVIKKLCNVLKKDCITNESCGLHVHLDMRNRNVKSNYKKLVDFLPNLTKLVRKERLESEYCKLNESNKYEYNSNDDDVYGYDEDGERYTAINKTAYEKHKTLEVRLHHGTIDPDEINNWIKLLKAKVNNRKIPKMCYNFYGKKLTA